MAYLPNPELDGSLCWDGRVPGAGTRLPAAFVVFFRRFVLEPSTKPPSHSLIFSFPSPSCASELVPGLVLFRCCDLYRQHFLKILFVLLLHLSLHNMAICAAHSTCCPSFILQCIPFIYPFPPKCSPRPHHRRRVRRDPLLDSCGLLDIHGILARRFPVVQTGVSHILRHRSAQGGGGEGQPLW